MPLTPSPDVGRLCVRAAVCGNEKCFRSGHVYRMTAKAKGAHKTHRTCLSFRGSLVGASAAGLLALALGAGSGSSSSSSCLAFLAFFPKLNPVTLPCTSIQVSGGRARSGQPPCIESIESLRLTPPACTLAKRTHHRAGRCDVTLPLCNIQHLGLGCFLGGVTLSIGARFLGLPLGTQLRDREGGRLQLVLKQTLSSGGCRRLLLRVPVHGLRSCQGQPEKSVQDSCR